MKNPLPLVLLVSIYLFIVTMGKRWMKHRPPMQIDPIIIAYNLMQIIINSAMVLAVSSTVRSQSNYSWKQRTIYVFDLLFCIHRSFVISSFSTQTSVFDVSRAIIPPTSTECS